MTSRLLLAVLLVAPALLRAQAPDPDLDAGLQQIVDEVKAGDMASVVDKMYEPFVDAAGGSEVMKAQATRAQSALAAKGLKIVSFEFIKPYQSVATSARDYRIIPVHSVMEVSAHRVEVKSFWLAIREHGVANWEYLDGEGLSRMPQLRDRLLPDLKGTPLPAVESKQLN